jgi:alkylation response protein AidB-like acyl-CoA dehydrogenase
MRFAFTDEQEALRRQARRLLERHASSAEVRRAMATDNGFDAALWQKLVELGWTALLVPEAYGGNGLGWVELAALMEEMGRTLACAPLFSTACLATNLLFAAGDEESLRTFLPAIAAGRLRATVAFAAADGVSVSDGRLNGTQAVVVDGHTADLVLVPTRDGLFAVDGKAAGLARQAQPTLDPTRKLCELQFAGVSPAARIAMKSGALERAVARAKIALAAEQLGGAERCLEMSIEYAKTRVQFGRPIGSFQAIKHRCADLLVLVESTRSAVYWAAACAATDDDELEVAASLARSYASEAYLTAAGETIQIHGGMGFTWEHDAHLHLRRARASATLFGDPPAERARLARHLGL